MTWVVVIDRSHHGPRFQGTFESREDAEAVRQQLIAEAPEWKDDIYVVRAGTAPELSTNGRD